MTDKNLEPLDDGVEFIVRTDKQVLEKMNEWCVSLAPALLSLFLRMVSSRARRRRCVKQHGKVRPRPVLSLRRLLEVAA